MRKNRGFTLIELLAVIVILAIIALIATPLILGVIEDSRKNSLKLTLNNIAHSGLLYLTNEMLKPNSKSNLDIILPFNDKDTETNNNIKLPYKGEDVDSGRIIIDDKGRVNIIIIKGKTCAYKNEFKGEKEPSVVEKKDIANWNEKCDINTMENPLLNGGPLCPGEIEISTDCIDIDNNGMLDNNRCGYNVIIPDSLNGIEIKGSEYGIFNDPESENNKGCVVFKTEKDTVSTGKFTIDEGSYFSIYIPSGVKKIELTTHHGIVETLSMPDSVETITRPSSWSSSAYINKVVIPAKVKEIEADLFSGKRMFEGVELKEGLQKIGNNAFSGAFDGGTVTIPTTVTSIGTTAFYDIDYSGIERGLDKVIIKGQCDRFGTQESEEFKSIFGTKTSLICE